MALGLPVLETARDPSSMASDHDGHTVFDRELFLLDGDFLYLFAVAEKKLSGEVVQTRIELAVALAKLLKLLALSQEKVVNTMGALLDQGFLLAPSRRGEFFI